MTTETKDRRLAHQLAEELRKEGGEYRNLSPGLIRQPKYQSEPCPTCGQPNRVLNPAWLRQRRTLAGITLREMARRLDLSAPYLSDVERGNRRCPVAIAAVYETLPKGGSGSGD